MKLDCLLVCVLLVDVVDIVINVQESAVPGINAEKVLGKHKNAFSVINKSSCVGVDYQPPTPAPVQHIGIYQPPTPAPV